MWRPSARRPATTGSTRRSARGGAIPASSTGCRCSMTISIRCSTMCPASRWCSTRWPTMRRPSGWPRSRTITMPGARAWARTSPASRPIARCRRRRSISSPRNGPSAPPSLPLARLTPVRRSGIGGPPRRRLRGAPGPQLHRRAGRRERQRVRGGGPPCPRPAGAQASASSSAPGRKARASASATCCRTTTCGRPSRSRRFSDALAYPRNEIPVGDLALWNPASRPAISRSSASRTSSATGWCARSASPSGRRIS